MSGGLTVESADGPAILIQPDGAIAHSDHGLDCDTHTGFQHDAVTSPTIVGHLRILVHLATDAMTGQLAYDAVLLCLTMLLHRTADITKVLTRYGILDA